MYYYTNANGCSNSATNTIQVTALPTVAWTNTLAAQCVSATTYAITGGTPTGGTYSGTGVTGNNFNASGAGTGTFTITYTYANANTCTSTATKSIIVNPRPVTEAGSDQTIILGNNASLAASASGTGGPFTFLWSNGSTNASISVSPTITTKYFVMATNTYGCSSFDSVRVIVNPAITDYLISTYNGQIITTCSGNFLDSGAGTGNYGNNQVYTTTICSNSLGSPGISLHFNSFNIDPSDTLFIYSGLFTSAPLIGGFNNSYPLLDSTISANASNSSGCLTLKFISNAATVASGWSAAISCSVLCQEVIAGIDPATTVPELINNAINVGTGDIFTLGGSAMFTQNNMLYSQSIATSTFIWNFGDGTIDTGMIIQHSYSSTGTHYVNLKVIDINGCQSSNLFYIAVIVANNFLTTTAQTLTACPGNIVVPITVSNFTGVSAISLKLSYNSSILTYTGYQNVNTALSIGTLLVNASNSKVQIAWFSILPATIGAGTLLDLNFSAVIGVSPLTWDLLTPGDCEYKDENNITINASFINGNISVGTCSNLTGILSYNNTASTPMTNTTVTLKQGGITVNQVTTSSSGNYTFANLANGTYITGGSCTKPWGGVNSSDALLILKHFVNTISLTGLRKIAADVDGSGYINSSDALFAAKRFVNIVTSFPIGDWVFEKDSVHITGTGNLVQNLKALTAGDVDGSFTPAAKETPSVFMLEEGEIMCTAGQSVQIPVLSEQNLSVAAVSLAINIPAGIDDVTSVKINTASPENSGTLIYNLSDNLLFVAWYSLVPINISTGDPLMFIGIKTGTGMPPTGVNLNFDPGSSMADVNVEKINEVYFSSPKLRNANAGFWLEQNKPNPFNDKTKISYNLTEESAVSFKVFNVLGNCIKTQNFSQLNTGIHTLEFEAADFENGIYFYTIESHGKNTSFNCERKMIIVK